MGTTEAGFSQTLQIPERMPVQRSDGLVLHISGGDDTARGTGIQQSGLDIQNHSAVPGANGWNLEL